MKRIALAAVLAIAAATPAFAATEFQARLASPMPESEKIVTKGALWSCEDDVCIARLNVSKPSLKACRALAKEAGEIATFGNANAALDEAALVKCNEAAR